MGGELYSNPKIRNRFRILGFEYSSPPISITTRLFLHSGEYSLRKDSKYLRGDALVNLVSPCSILVLPSLIKIQACSPLSPSISTRLDSLTLPSATLETLPANPKSIYKP